MRRVHILTFLLGIGLLGLYILFLSSGAKIETLLYCKTEQWKTLSGEVRSVDQADRFLHKVLANSDATALSVAVISGNQVVFQQEMGIVDEKSWKRVDEKTVFRSASLSKPVFAYLVMKVIDEGLIEVDKPVYKYLERPLFEYSEYKDLKEDGRYKLLTARLLLSHQSGFPNWRFMNQDSRLNFNFTPGDMFKYSGEGYGLLQLVLEKITEKGLNQLAKEKVFQPLGMINSSFVWERRFDGTFAVNLNTGLRKLIERTKHIPKAAASLLTNTNDYSKFLLAVMNGRGLKPETLKLMLEPQVDITSESLHAPQGSDPEIHNKMQLAWSLGWGRFRCLAGDAIFHVGFEEGCDNYVVAFLDRKIGIVLQSAIATMDGIAPPITKELIGDVYSPFKWLNY